MEIAFRLKPFHKTVSVGLLESTSLWVGIPIEVRLPTNWISPDPAKAGPTLGGVVVVVVVVFVDEDLS